MTAFWNERKRDVLPCLGLCLCGFFVVLHFCAGTSPLRPDEYLWDSALFQAVGKLWADGMLPYRDIFDHKGPLLFWIQRLAYGFANPRMALYVLESTFVSVSLCLGYATLRRKMSRPSAFLGGVLMLIFWLPLMEYGNLCETYSMPFLMIPLYLQLKFLYSGSKKHPLPYAFIYGLCFGANLMIRPNNGLLTALVTFVIAIELPIRRQWTNLLQNGFWLIAGVLIPVVPFVAYFAWHGALQEMIYATWTFNLIYAESLELELVMQNLRNVLFFITPALLFLFLTGVCVLRKRWRLALIHLLSAVGTLYITLSGIGYTHYFMLHVPLVVVALCTARELSDTPGWKRLMLLVCAAFVLLTVRTTATIAQANWVAPPTAEEQAQEDAFDEMIDAILAAIPQEERDSVAMCGLMVTDAELILKTDLHPLGRYCFLMEWHARADGSIIDRYVRFLQSREAKWVILRQEGVSDLGVLVALDDHYLLHSAFALDGANYLLFQQKI